MVDMPIIDCKGVQFESFNVEPFQLFDRELIAVVKPWAYADRDRLMELFSGRPRTPGLLVNANVGLIRPWLGFGADHLRRTVRDILSQDGIVSPPAAEEIVTGLRVGLDEPYGIQQLTDKTLLAIRVGLNQGARAVVVSMSGLDPLGVASVYAELRRLEAAALVIISDKFASGEECEFACDRSVRILKSGD